MTREEWLTAFIAAARPVFEDAGSPIPALVRAATGFPSTGRKGKRIGECWTDEASDDANFEIFVHPSVAETDMVAAVLTHELIHTSEGLAAKHGPKFRRVAHALGLQGKMTATTTGPDWAKWAAPVIAALGPYPHGRLNTETSQTKTQTTRMLKCECPDCGFTFRTSAKWLQLGQEDGLCCPVPTCDGIIPVDSGEPEED